MGGDLLASGSAMSSQSVDPTHGVRQVAEGMVRLQALTAAVAAAAICASAAPASAQSMVSCKWDRFWIDSSPTYRIGADRWERFDKAAWAWVPFGCDAYMAMPARCTVQTIDRLYSRIAKVAQDDGLSYSRYDLEIEIDRISGEAHWTRSGKSTYPASPDLNMVVDEQGSGKCEAATDPAGTPRPAPRM